MIKFKNYFKNFFFIKFKRIILIKLYRIFLKVNPLITHHLLILFFFLEIKKKYKKKERDGIELGFCFVTDVCSKVTRRRGGNQSPVLVWKQSTSCLILFFKFRFEWVVGLSGPTLLSPLPPYSVCILLLLCYNQNYYVHQRVLPTTATYLATKLGFSAFWRFANSNPQLTSSVIFKK